MFILTVMASPHFHSALSPRHSTSAVSVTTKHGAPNNVAVDIPRDVKVDIPGTPMEATADIPVVTGLPKHTVAGHEAISGTDPTITLACSKQPTLPTTCHIHSDIKPFCLTVISSIMFLFPQLPLFRKVYFCIKQTTLYCKYSQNFYCPLVLSFYLNQSAKCMYISSCEGAD